MTPSLLAGLLLAAAPTVAATPTTSATAAATTPAGDPFAGLHFLLGEWVAGEVLVTFSVAPPGGEFRPYVSGAMRRQAP